VHGAAQHHVRGRGTGLRLRARGQLGQEGGDDVLEADGLAVDLGFFQQQRAAQQAFERAHQPAFGARQVLRHGIAPKVRAVVFRIEKQRRGHGQRIAFQRQRLGQPTVLPPGHGGIGGAEVDAQHACGGVARRWVRTGAGDR